MANKKLKNVIRKIHLYLGFVSGIIVFIVAITGCCWVFQEEFTNWIDGDRTVEKQNASLITITEAKKIGLSVFPDKTIHGIAFGREKKVVEVIFYEAEPEFYHSVYLNPYTGDVIEVKNHRSGFFWFALKGHLYLWLPKAIGSQLTAYGTMIFVILLITGIILWWPKNKKNRKQRFTLDWKSTTRWKRKNFDLHSVVGFYVSIFALILAFSGLIMAFNWVYYATYVSWGGNKAPQFIIPNNTSKPGIQTPHNTSIDHLFGKLTKEYKDYDKLEFHIPATDSTSIYVEVSSQKGVYYNSDYLFFDQYTLQEIESNSIYGKYTNTSAADKMIRMNYDIHVGAIGGITGKILAFIISLIAASLPVTGVLLWWGRKKKKKKQKLPDTTKKSLSTVA